MYADDQKFGKPYKFKVFVENESEGINRIPKSAKIIKCKNCSVGNKDSKLGYTRCKHSTYSQIFLFMGFDIKAPHSLKYKLWYIYTVVCSLSFRIRAPF
jgi:hypothetical protein